jgi:pyrroline-5-carboxylate reductase
MGSAILGGLLKSGFNPDNVSVSTKSTASAERLADEVGVLSFAMENGDDANQMAVAGANVVLICVKLPTSQKSWLTSPIHWMTTR